MQSIIFWGGCSTLQKEVKVKLNEIVKLTEGQIVCGCESDSEIKYGFSADLLSDVLTLDTENLLLITGLSNLQTIRTAEISDIQYILFARGKKVSEEMKELAAKNDMVLIQSCFSVFKVSGLLYNSGLEPIY